MKLPTLSYSLSRPYPYKWFLPAVIVGGLFAATFVSLLNYAVNGFYLSNKYTSDFNGTISRRDWTQLNAQFYTDKLSLPYTITAIWQRKDGIMDAPIPELPYANNVLEDCAVNNILIDLESSQRTAEQKGWAGWGIKASALIACSVTNSLGKTTLNLTTSYEYVTSTIGLGSPYSFLQRDSEKRASLWWGETLLSWYWLYLGQTTSNNSVATFGGDTYTLVQGSMIFHPTNVSDISSRSFFELGNYHLLASNGEFVGFSNFPLIDNIREETYPNIWAPADTFAKVFYSAILTDLGSNTSANVLTEATLLQNLSDFENMPDVTGRWLSFGPATEGYARLKDSTGPLGTTPSTIYAQYLCQVVEQKPGGSLFVAVLVADLVILQALWKLTNWAMTLWLEHQDPRSNRCAGCLAKQRYAGDGDELTDAVNGDGAMVSSELLVQRKA